MLNLPVRTLLSSVWMLGSSNGRRPQSSAKRMIPQLQMSLVVPSYDLPLTISGEA